MKRERQHAPQGEVSFKEIQPQQRAQGAALANGIWCLGTKSTVPFVRIQSGQQGARDITWGEAFYVEADAAVQVINGSFHSGDIWLSQIVETEIPPPPPARVTFPAIISREEGLDPNRVTQWIDARLAHRIFLCVPQLGPGIVYTSQHRGPTRGRAFSSAATPAKAAGVLSYQVTAVGPLKMLPLGIACSEYLDTAGKTLPEYRPMAFLDQVRVVAANAQAQIGFETTADAFYLIEYH